MSKFSNKWKVFWEGKKCPLHSCDDDEYYKIYGQELSLLYNKFNFDSVLEVGCGNGVLYPHLGFIKKNYTGVDLSSTMIEDFKKRHPNKKIKLSVVEPGEIYKDKKFYDLIFQNGVIQHFDQTMLNEFMDVSYNMLNKGGKIVIGSIPWKLCKRKYYFRGFNQTKASYLAMLYSYLKSHKSAMGRWYSFSDFRTFTKKYPLKVEFFGSLLYPYRFHVVFTKE